VRWGIVDLAEALAVFMLRQTDEFKDAGELRLLPSIAKVKS